MHKTKSLPRILAIDPGTKELGVAFLEGEKDLVYFAVKSFRVERDPKHVRKAIRKAIERVICLFNPETLVLEQLAYVQQKNSKLLRFVYEDLKKLGKDFALDIVEMAPSTARKILIGDGRATKLEVAKALCLRFPELQAVVIEKNRRAWQQSYWQNATDSIALAIAHQIKTNKRTK